MILESNDLEIGYKNSTIVSGIHLSLAAGSKSLIIAENGQGKTTLLRTLAGLQTKLGGQLRTPMRHEIGWAHGKERGFFPNLTGQENLLFFKKMEHFSPPQIHDMLSTFSSIPVLEHCLKTKFSDCSSGMKQTLLLIHSLMGQQKLILWDEPFRGISDSNIKGLQEFVALHCTDRTLIISDHRVNHWKNICQRTFHISGKKLHEI